MSPAVTRLTACVATALTLSASCGFIFPSHADTLAAASIKPAVSVAELTPTSPSPHWQLVWQDEFDGASLNPDNWQVEQNCWGGGNNEQQCYVDAPDVIAVNNDMLTLTARNATTTGPRVSESFSDYDIAPNRTLPFRSARVKTKDKHAWTYGRFEIRAKLPYGQGTWPAIWMLPQQDIYGGWAASGEIDIMEAVNLHSQSDAIGAADGQRETRIHGTLHYGAQWPDNVYSGASIIMPDEASPAEQFYTYAIEWEADEIRWYIDDYHYATQTSDTWYTQDPDKRAPFNQDFFMILNVAVGGNWAGKVNEGGIDESVFPQSMVVDYVRVYQCPDNKDC